MGYTHYWERPVKLDAQRYALWQRMAKIILKEKPATALANYMRRVHMIPHIAGPLGTGLPIITPDTFRINGSDKQRISVSQGDLFPTKTVGCAHESFIMDRVMTLDQWDRPEKSGMYFQFCKTAQKPYDIIVTACLIAFSHVFPEYPVSSDGDPGKPMMDQAIDFYQRTFEIAVPQREPWVAPPGALTA